MSKPHILFIDNVDSFTFNLVDAFEVLGAEVELYRNDIGAEAALDIARGKHSSLVVLSAGPGTPREAGCTLELIQKAAGKLPLLGIGLGHQAIAEAFGGEVGAARRILHGKKSKVKHGGHPLFAGVPEVFEAGCYHSWVVKHLPEGFHAIAQEVEEGGPLMAMTHKTQPVYGLQFHPESILTTHGQTIVQNVFALVVAGRKP